MATARLVESCNTALRCSCGSQQFRIHMDCDDATDEVSSTVMNNVECQSCHALYQLAYDADPNELSRLHNAVVEQDNDNARLRSQLKTARDALQSIYGRGGGWGHDQVRETARAALALIDEPGA